MIASPIKLTFSNGVVERGDLHCVAFCVKRRHFFIYKRIDNFPLIRYKKIVTLAMAKNP